MKLTLRPSLLSSLSLLSASLLVGVSTVRAQECSEDTDCDENFECVEYNETSVGEAPPMTAMMTPADNTAPPATNCDGEGCDGATPDDGTASEDDAAPVDEAPPEDAVNDDPSMDEDLVAAAPEADGGTPEMEAESSTAGSCQPVILSCNESADCPDPAKCEEGECVFLIEQCEEDAECGEGFLCTLVSTSGTCSTPSVGSSAPSGNPVMMPAMMADDATDPAGVDSAGVDSGAGTMTSGGSAAAGGSSAEPTAEGKPLAPASNGDPNGDSEDDPDSTDAPAPGAADGAPAQDEQTMCTVTENRACFPALVECSTDADCSGDWTCEDMSERAPAGWGDIERACLPPGITAALAGHVRTGGDVVVSVDSSELGGEGRPQGPTDVDQNPVTPGSGMGNSNEVESPVELGTQGGTEGSMGCSTGPRTPRGGSLAWLAALGALVFASRRRLAR